MTAMTSSALSQTYELPPDAAQRLSRDGFVRLPGVLSTELISEFEPAITGGVIELNTMHLPMEERDTYNRAFLQVENLWCHYDRVKEFVFSRRLARIAAELLGVDGVRLYHDQALYKEPSGGITPWHADQYYWPLNSDRTITVWIPLQDTPTELGPLEFAAGSQHFEFGRDLPISDESERSLQQALETEGFGADRSPYKAGDVSYHLGWTFHRAGPNRSQLPRRVMTIIYVDADITVTEPVNDKQRLDLDTWMPGTTPGSTPDSPLNPVLFFRAST
ncbi:MAG: phytanoyl-CoA dioxygenase family protein [Jatrophihabitans sp.]